MRLEKIKKRFRRGAGEAVSYAIAMPMLLVLFLLLLGVFFLYQSLQAGDEIAQNVARDVVVCTSLEDAQELAQEDAEEKLLERSTNYYIEGVTAYVDYALTTSEEEPEWKKGEIIIVSLDLDIKGFLPVFSKVYTVTVTTQVEHDG